ncbi:MAG: hypothetical protein V1804_04665 [Patescibacteria group bacterium]
MLEKFFPSKKKEKPKKPSGPSFEELVLALPKDEQDELKRLKNVPEELATGDRIDGGFEIDHSTLSEDDKKFLYRYYTLLKKASDILEQKK